MSHSVLYSLFMTRSFSCCIRFKTFSKKIGCPVFMLMLMMMIVREMLELIELEQLELDLEPNGKKKAGPAR